MNKVIEAGMKAGYDHGIAFINNTPHKLAINPYKGKKFHVYNRAQIAGFMIARGSELIEF